MTTLTKAPEKICSVCKICKSVDNFRPRKNYRFGVSCRCKECDALVNRQTYQRHKERYIEANSKYNKENRDKINQASKKRRQKNLVKFRATDRANYQKNKERFLKARIKYIYGLEADEYEALLQKFDYKCAICKSQNDLCVDHCHDTSKVRGILCRKCNAGIGFLGDNFNALKKAIAYLKKYE